MMWLISSATVMSLCLKRDQIRNFSLAPAEPEDCHQLSKMSNEKGGAEMRFLTQKCRTEVLLGSGLVGPLLFIVVFLIEGFTRPDYDPYRNMVSELSLSSWGWQQIANFLMCGTLMLAFAIRLRRVDTSRWAARVLTLTALGMLMAGAFVCDPGLAYPAGAPDALPLAGGSWHNQLHGVAGFTVFFSLPIAIALMAA